MNLFDADHQYVIIVLKWFTVDEKLMNAIDEAKLLGYFKSLCEYYSSNEQVSKLRDIMALSSNKQYTIKNLINLIQTYFIQ